MWQSGLVCLLAACFTETSVENGKSTPKRKIEGMLPIIILAASVEILLVDDCFGF